MLFLLYDSMYVYQHLFIYVYFLQYQDLDTKSISPFRRIQLEAMVPVSFSINNNLICHFCCYVEVCTEIVSCFVFTLNDIDDSFDKRGC